jgi:hypothetical protein
MKKTLLVVVALAGAVLGAQPAPLTAPQPLERRGIGDPGFSPMPRLVFTVTERQSAARRRSLWMLTSPAAASAS